MRNWGIITKITVSANGVILLLLVVGGFLLIRFEINLVDTFHEEFTANITESIGDRKNAETESLRNTVIFTTQILSEISAKHLYDIDPDAIVQPLRSYMNYPEIQAIQVIDDTGQPFAAIWRTPELKNSNALPENLTVNQQLSIQTDAIYKDKTMGRVTVYYTDAGLTEKIARAQEKSFADASLLDTKLRLRLTGAIRNQSLAVFVVMLCVWACLFVLLRIFVVKPIRTISGIAVKLADFDLTVTIPMTLKDEIGQLFLALHNMVQSFKQVLSQVQRAGIQVTSSATELSATAKQQEVIVAAQMESTRRVTRAVQNISQVAVELAETMQQMAAMLQETVGFATTGRSELSRMQNAVQHMENASTSISAKLQTINEKADSITSVATTINKVAEQTNLLSLNAAIEAEKAGEYGRGFTVVAREIRRLADQTAVATLDIERMVHDMQSAVSAGVMEMDKFITKVRYSAEDVERISRQLTKIIEQVQALSPNVARINLSMEQQSEDARGINAAMVSLGEEMQQTKDSLHETYTAIEQLNEVSRDLHTHVSRFKVT